MCRVDENSWGKERRDAENEEPSNHPAVISGGDSSSNEAFLKLITTLQGNQDKKGVKPHQKSATSFVQLQQCRLSNT